jgi:hypothetical protein
MLSNTETVRPELTTSSICDLVPQATKLEYQLGGTEQLEIVDRDLAQQLFSNVHNWETQSVVAGPLRVTRAMLDSWLSVLNSSDVETADLLAESRKFETSFRRFTANAMRPVLTHNLQAGYAHELTGFEPYFIDGTTGPDDIAAQIAALGKLVQTLDLQFAQANRTKPTVPQLLAASVGSFSSRQLIAMDVIMAQTIAPLRAQLYDHVQAVEYQKAMEASAAAIPDAVKPFRYFQDGNIVYQYFILPKPPETVPLTPTQKTVDDLGDDYRIMQRLGQFAGHPLTRALVCLTPAQL